MSEAPRSHEGGEGREGDRGERGEEVRHCRAFDTKIPEVQQERQLAGVSGGISAGIREGVSVQREHDFPPDGRYAGEHRSAVRRFRDLRRDKRAARLRRQRPDLCDLRRGQGHQEVQQMQSGAVLRQGVSAIALVHAQKGVRQIGPVTGEQRKAHGCR